jgi:cytochrome c2
MKKLCASFVALAVMLLASSFAANAGGWAVTTLDELPAQVIAGKPVPIGFTVRQHGRTLVNELSPVIKAVRADGAATLQATARNDSNGHYAVALTFPSAGQWQWSIDAFGFDQPMPALDVLTAAGAPTPAPAEAVRAGSVPDLSAIAPSLPLLIGVLGAAGVLVALVAWMRTRRPMLLGLLVAATAVSAFSFGLAANRPALPAQADHPSGTSSTTSSIGDDMGEGVDEGAALFLAKGCVVCHTHTGFTEARREFSGLQVGPDLTVSSRDAAYLRVWLKDPAAIKPGTEMPNLGLSQTEIESLVAFLKESKGAQ